MKAPITELEFSLGAGSGCPMKVLHSRAGLPRNDTDTSFSGWMRAEAGKVHALARHLFATVPTESGEHAFELLRQGDCTVADVTFGTADATCRVDFVSRQGAFIRLYQVVPKCIDLERHKRQLEFTRESGTLRPEWRPHLELMAFRVWIARQLFPELRVVPLFVAPVRGAQTKTEGLHGRFRETVAGWRIDDPVAPREAAGLLRTVSVSDVCLPLVDSIPVRAKALAEAVTSGAVPVIGYRCKKCEYRTGPGGGFARCWGALADVEPHMFSLTWMYEIKGPDGRPIADTLAEVGKVGMHDIPLDRIVGEHAPRQLMQLEGTREQKEIIDPELAEKLAEVTCPVFFLDIETVRSLVPCHRGGTVNSLTLFQFSIHRRDVPDGPLTHLGWLNLEQECPNDRFLSALRSALGEQGTTFVYTGYEQQSFAELLAAMIGSGEENDNMRWLRRFLVSDRVVDLYKICFEHYWHPLMGGSASIKSLFPAVWSVDSPVKERAPYNEFPGAIDPYRFLKNKGGVADGCDAMLAYLELQSGGSRQKAADDLLKYCYVDTLAMVYIYDYLCWRLKESTVPEAVVAGNSSSPALPAQVLPGGAA